MIGEATHRIASRRLDRRVRLPPQRLDGHLAQPELLAAAASCFETLQQVLNEEPPPLRSLNASVPRDLETICLKCLNKAPARRYESAAALADALPRWLDREPIL